uniref:adhesion G-protein coupled receptor G6-like isoform X1 n=1 Tax=Styela clava TaxID=7725 RepID=UPI0019393E7B|nr:adhesion G-protein coupled receptor G6-like isoform X1 [Styela clava]
MSQPANVTVAALDLPGTELNSGDGINGTTTANMDSESLLIRNIVSYVGASVAIAGILLTLLSYIGYRKFHIKRPHIIMVNLCICLFLYYLAYLISNHERQTTGDSGNVCLFGAIVCHFSVLAAWFWLFVYWMLILVMFRRPMGGHISHFFIKASIPAYGISLGIAIICAAVATQHVGGIHGGEYYGPQCFVHKLYQWGGTMVPVGMTFIGMLIIFGMILHGVFFAKQNERLQNSSSRRNVKMHFIRLTVITVLLAIVIISSCFDQREPSEKELGGIIVFSAGSSILGLSLMVLFCLHHEEIRSHWVSVIRGDDSQIRKHSINRNKYEVGGDLPSSRKSSTLMGNHPSVYIESYEDERKSSTYRIVAKEDTDMSTLGLIQIPGTPSPGRNHDSNAEKYNDSAKVRRKKSDASSKTRHIVSTNNNETPPTSPRSPDDKSGTGTKSRKKKSRSVSTPPVSPVQKRPKSAKRQMTSDHLPTENKPTSPTNGPPTEGKRKNSKRGNSSHRLSKSRFLRKSESTLDEDTVQLTDFK